MQKSSIYLLALYDAMEKSGTYVPGMEKEAGLEKLTGLLGRLFSRGGARAAQAAGGAAGRSGGVLSRLRNFFSRWGGKGAPTAPAPNTFSVAQMRGAGAAPAAVRTPLVGAAAKPTVKLAPNANTIATSIDKANPASNIVRQGVSGGHRKLMTVAQRNAQEAKRLAEVRKAQDAAKLPLIPTNAAGLTAEEVAAQNARVAATPTGELMPSMESLTKGTPSLNETYGQVFKDFETKGYNTIRKQIGGISKTNFRDVMGEARRLKALKATRRLTNEEAGILDNYTNAMKEFQKIKGIIRHYNRLGAKVPEGALQKFNQLKSWMERPYNPKLVKTAPAPTSTPTQVPTVAAQEGAAVKSPEVKVAPSAAAAEGEAGAAASGPAMPNGNGNQVVNINSGNGAGGGGGMGKPLIAGGIGGFLGAKFLGGNNGGGGYGAPVVVNSQPAYPTPQIGGPMGMMGALSPYM